MAGTQDAYAKADSAQIRTRVSGTVSRVLVDNKDPDNRSRRET
jgi:multidrug resistance efflux pump